MDRDLYGAQETNGIAPGYHNEPIVGTLDWTSPDLAKITRLRLLSDPGYPAWDVSSFREAARCAAPSSSGHGSDPCNP